MARSLCDGDNYFTIPYIQWIEILGGGLFQVRNQIILVGILLQAGESHLVPRNVLLGVGEVLENGVGRPVNAFSLHGVGIGEVILCAGCPAEHTVQIWADLVGSALLECVALHATRLEQLGTLLCVTRLVSHDVCCDESKT